MSSSMAGARWRSVQRGGRECHGWMDGRMDGLSSLLLGCGRCINQPQPSSARPARPLRWLLAFTSAFRFFALHLHLHFCPRRCFRRPPASSDPTCRLSNAVETRATALRLALSALRPASGPVALLSCFCAADQARGCSPPPPQRPRLLCPPSYLPTRLLPARQASIEASASSGTSTCILPPSPTLHVRTRPD